MSPRKIMQPPENDLESQSTASSAGEVSEPEGSKKKQQNSLRWKRWWLKNREVYNEKRRLSAQLKSAKSRAEKSARASIKNKINVIPEAEAEAASKRVRLVEQTASVTPTVTPRGGMVGSMTMGYPSGAISPPLSIRSLPMSLMPPLPVPNHGQASYYPAINATWKQPISQSMMYQQPQIMMRPAFTHPQMMQNGPMMGHNIVYGYPPQYQMLFNGKQ